MTKRFTPKASTYTAQLADVQARASKLRNELAKLEAEERGLKAFLMPFYDSGKTEVVDQDRNYLVNFSVTNRTYLNQDRARAIILAAGKRVPTSTTDVVSFNVKKVKP